MHFKPPIKRCRISLSLRHSLCNRNFTAKESTGQLSMQQQQHSLGAFLARKLPIQLSAQKTSDSSLFWSAGKLFCSFCGVLPEIRPHSWEHGTHKQTHTHSELSLSCQLPDKDEIDLLAAGLLHINIIWESERPCKSRERRAYFILLKPLFLSGRRNRAH